MIRRIPLSLSCLLLLTPIACQEQAYCFDGCDDPGAVGGSSAQGGTSGASEGGAANTGGSSVSFASGGAGDCDAELETDPENCGECGNICVLANAFSACEAGHCVIDECLAGFFDVDSSVAGCETRCIDVDFPGTEDCDGLDNDCDGSIDEADDMRSPPTNLCRSTPGTPCADTEVVCDTVQGTWSCSYPPGVEASGNQVLSTESRCDGIDGDCDGQIDDDFPELGDVCADQGLGVCRDEGVVACDPTTDDWADTYCDLSAGPDPRDPDTEICNGLDDDCNGVVDDGIDFNMVPIPDSASPSFYVDRFEASRHDASASSAGVRETIACSTGAVLPWTAIAWEKARAVCEARGSAYRLCSALELAEACSAGGVNSYPYGSLYEPETCNAWDYDDDTNVVLPTGALDGCVTASGLFDLSGNATEWTSTDTTGLGGSSAIYQLHGGSYLAPAEGVACSIALAPRAAPATILPTVGFRCCADL